MILLKHLGIGFLLLGVVLGLEYYTDWDIILQNYFYDAPNRQWMINPAEHKQLSIFFYKGLKNILIAIGAFSLLYLAASLKYDNLKSHRKPFLILLLSIIFVPVIVAGAKYITNVYCPYQLDIYNGINPFVRVLDSYPEGFVQLKPGRCFPAGHATAGFALMALFYCFKTRRNRILGLLAGIALGWTAGIYQMMRGQHFLSHTLFSMIASFMVIMVINAAVSRIFNKKISSITKA